MRRSIIITLLLAFFVASLTIGCGNKNSNTVQREAILKSVWQQLLKAEQNEIMGDWKGGTIEKTIAKQDSMTFLLQDKEFHGREVYLVTFPSKYVHTLGNVRKLVDMESSKIIGTGLRD